jgi:hypothetical protein
MQLCLIKENNNTQQTFNPIKTPTMSTTYLPNQSAGGRYAYANARPTANNYQQKTIQPEPTSFLQRIDEGHLMVGIFCFLVPTLFSSVAFGLHYLLVEDLITYGIYIGGAAIASRIAMSIIIKGIAADKNRSESFWMSFAAVFPALSLICMSLVGKKPSAYVPAEKIAEKRTEKNYSPALPTHVAREIYMQHRSKAM